MQHETRNPMARAGATGLPGNFNYVGNELNTPFSPLSQENIAAIIAVHHHLSPVRARLVVSLAGLGRRAD